MMLIPVMLQTVHPDGTSFSINDCHDLTVLAEDDGCWNTDAVCHHANVCDPWYHITFAAFWGIVW